jgi:predicted hydrocarbon binding protein
MPTLLLARPTVTGIARMKEITHEDYKKHTQNWIRTIIAGMDSHLDDATRSQLLEACGRACARGEGASPASQCQGDLDKFLAMVRIWHGADETVVRDGDIVTILCSRCMCPLVGDNPGRLSGSFCECSFGWMKENFETILGRPVDVEVAETIHRGGEGCRFTIHI